VNTDRFMMLPLQGLNYISRLSSLFDGDTSYEVTDSLELRTSRAALDGIKSKTNKLRTD
jgi:hypothetical protein